MPKLAQLIRAKFPKQYDDMDDATLEKAILAKYPEYADVNKEEQPVQTQPAPAVSVKTEEPKRSITSYVMDPLTEAPTKWGQAASDVITQPKLDTSVPMAMAKGFVGGATEGLGKVASSLTSPFNVAMTLLTLGANQSLKGIGSGASAVMDAEKAIMAARQAGKGIPEINAAIQELNAARRMAGQAGAVNKLANTGQTIGGAGMIGQGGYNVINEPDVSGKLGGLSEIAMGAIPALQGFRGLRNVGKTVAELMPYEQPMAVQPQRFLPPANRPIGLLPQNASLAPIEPRFFQGKAGLGDSQARYQNDISPVMDTQMGPNGAILGPRGEALTDAELGNVVDMPAMYMAEKYGQRVGAEATAFPKTATTRLLEGAQESQMMQAPPKPQPKLFGPTARESVDSGNYESFFDSAGNLHIKTGVTGIVQKSSSQAPPNVKTKEVIWRLDPAAAKKVEAADIDLNPFATEPPRGPWGQAVAMFKAKLDNNPAIASMQDWLTSRAGTVLKRVSPDMYQAMYNARAEKAGLYGELAGRLEGAVSKLSMKEAANWQQVLEGKASPLNDKVKLVVAASEKITGPEGAIVTLARKYGVKMAKGDDFHAVEKYWPRMPGAGFIEANAALIERMMKAEGLSRHEVINILRGAKKYGPRYGSYLKERKGTLDNHRTDPAAYFDHVAVSINDIINTKFFKQGDLSNKTSPLNLWIEKSSAPDRARKIAEAYFNRDPAADFGDSTLANAMSVWAASTKLQNIILSNLAPQAMTFSRMSSKQFSKSLIDTLTGAQKNGDIGDVTGVLYHLQKQLASEYGSGSKIVNKGFGLKYSERTNRGFAAAVSKATAESYFDALKVNPGNKVARAELGNLIGEHPDLLLKQEVLTKAQLDKAAYNGSIMTQGSVSTLDLPLNWTTNKSLPIRMITLFKKFAYNNTGLVMDLARNNPKAFAKFLPATLLMGEIIGDTKAAIRGTVSGAVGGQDIGDSIAEEIAKRGQYISPDNPLMSRVIDNFNQGWFGGIISDVITSSLSRGKEGILGVLAGPIGGDIAEIGGQAATDPLNWTAWRKKLLTRLPIPGQIGRGIEEGLQKREGTR
jgi:hypothetical protein